VRSGKSGDIGCHGVGVGNNRIHCMMRWCLLCDCYVIVMWLIPFDMMFVSFLWVWGLCFVIVGMWGPNRHEYCSGNDYFVQFQKAKIVPYTCNSRLDNVRLQVLVKVSVIILLFKEGSTSTRTANRK